MDSRLALTITRGDGSTKRWGPDEPDGRDVPDDLTLTDSMPGGDKALACSLMRDLTYKNDENLFDNVFCYGPGKEAVWEGRTAQFPHSNDQVSPSAVGYIAHLNDDTTAREVYIDRDMAQWQTYPASNKVQLFAAGWNPSDGQKMADPGAGEPCIGLELNSPWDTGSLPVCDSMYDIGVGLSIAQIIYRWVTCNNTLDAPAPVLGTWIAQVILSGGDDSGVGAAIDWNDLAVGVGLTSAGQGELDASGAIRRYAWLNFGNNAPYSFVNLKFGLYFAALTVIGNHGLTRRGAFPTPYPNGASRAVSDSVFDYGFFVSDIVANIVSRWGPLVNFTYPGSIEVSEFIVPHFVQYTMSTAYNMIAAANAFEMMDWGVTSGGFDNYPRRTFFLRQRDPARLTWRARVADGAILTNEGVQADEMVNGVVVNFQTPDGASHTAGPIGSGCNFEDARLMDTDPTNPVNEHSIPRKFGQVNMSKVTTPAGAIQVGQLWISRRVGIQKRGTINLQNKVLHPNGVYYPTSRVRSGDYVIVEDDTRDNDPRQIINRTYSHKTRTASCDLEHDAFRLDALMAQMGAELVGIT